MIKILPLSECSEHVPTVAQWLHEEWGKNKPDASLSQAVKALKVLPDKDGLPISFLAMRQNSPVGVARLVKYDMDTRSDLTPWLANVFVPAPLRRQGIGTQLCAKVIDEAKALGFQKIFLFTPDRQFFYAKQGWTVLDRTIYRNQEVTIMQRAIGESDADVDGGSHVSECFWKVR